MGDENTYLNLFFLDLLHQLFSKLLKAYNTFFGMAKIATGNKCQRTILCMAVGGMHVFVVPFLDDEVAYSSLVP